MQDPDRRQYDAYFRKVWIPDESYFQTLARIYSTQIESRSLTLSKFDFQGKPHIFYDDHLQLLRRSDCFVARKIWPHASRLYEAFLSDSNAAMKHTEPNPGKIDRIFAKAVDRRTRGCAGLYMQSRLPNSGWENGVTAGLRRCHCSTRTAILWKSAKRRRSCSASRANFWMFCAHPIGRRVSASEKWPNSSKRRWNHCKRSSMKLALPRRAT